MNIQLLEAAEKDKTVIENLLQFYIYDFSEYMSLDVKDDGKFASYPQLESYWTESNKFPYIIKAEDKYAGFVLVKLVSNADSAYFSMAEFFILKKFRLSGIGKSIAFRVFELHKGQWEIFQRNSNKPAQLFWRKVIHEYSGGKFSEHAEEGKQVQRFVSL
ncbi:GNAT family N-acetyltransferase [Ferruginibacter sp.]